MRKKEISNKLAVICLFLLTFCGFAHANKIIYVDDDGQADFNNIQAAIDDANDGDTVFVSEGTYYENITMKDGITLKGAGADKTTIIGNYGHGVTFNSISGKISGFKITRNINNPSFGDGIFTSQSNVKIENNIIENNRRGISVSSNSFALITGNQIINNKGLIGYGVNIDSSNAIIKNNNISGNSYGGIKGSKSSPNICNNTICGNGHYGIDCDPSSIQIIVNNIISCNEIGILVLGGSEPSFPLLEISYNNVWNNSYSNYLSEWGTTCLIDDPCCVPQGGSGPFEPQPGIGEMSIDPLFADPNNGDYLLKSQAGRFDVTTQSWVQDDVTSPCIDAGDPNSPIGYEPFPNGGYINMGAYGGTVEASKSYFGKPVCETMVAGDINGDCKVDELDMAIMMIHWLEDYNPVSVKVIDGVEFRIQTDKTFYKPGENVQMDFTVTNNTNETVHISCYQSREFNLLVQKDGTQIWTLSQVFIQNFSVVELSAGETKGISHSWDMKDNDGYLVVDPGTYTIVGEMFNYDFGPETVGPTEVKIAITISASTEP